VPGLRAAAGDVRQYSSPLEFRPVNIGQEQTTCPWYRASLGRKLIRRAPSPSAYNRSCFNQSRHNGADHNRCHRWAVVCDLFPARQRKLRLCDDGAMSGSSAGAWRMVPTQSIPWHSIWDQRHLGVEPLAAVQERLSMAVASRSAGPRQSQGESHPPHAVAWTPQYPVARSSGLPPPSQCNKTTQKTEAGELDHI
jgi:hypothetical protein